MGSKTQINRFQQALANILTDRPISYHGCFAKAGGGVQAGVFLAQLLYWTPRGKLEGGWVWKTKADWTRETGMTVTEIDHARRELKRRGILEEKLTGVPATLHYRVDMERLAKLLSEGYEEEKPERPRDDKGRFVPVTQKQDNCPSSPEIGELDTGKQENWMPGKRVTSNPENGQLSIDDTETTIEDTVSPQASATPNSAQPLPSEAQRVRALQAEMEGKSGKEIMDGFMGPPRSGSNGKMKPPDGTEPWLRWGGGKVRPRNGISALSLQRVGWMVEQAMGGWYPVDGEWSGWMKAMVQMYEVADGDFDKIQAGIEWAKQRDPKYWPEHPMGFVKAIRKAKTVPKKPTPAERRKRERERMERDPQVQAFM